jgi:hypothetical protein
MVPETVRQQVPECREQGSSNQRFEEWYPEEDGITRDDEDHHIGDNPYPHQRGNDGTNDAEREPPAYHAPALRFVSMGQVHRREQTCLDMRQPLLASPAPRGLSVQFRRRCPAALSAVDPTGPQLITSDTRLLIPPGGESRHQGVFSAACV